MKEGLTDRRSETYEETSERQNEPVEERPKARSEMQEGDVPSMEAAIVRESGTKFLFHPCTLHPNNLHSSPLIKSREPTVIGMSSITMKL